LILRINVLVAEAGMSQQNACLNFFLRDPFNHQIRIRIVRDAGFLIRAFAITDKILPRILTEKPGTYCFGNTLIIARNQQLT
jgi:hypothetical protein